MKIMKEGMRYEFWIFVFFSEDDFNLLLHSSCLFSSLYLSPYSCYYYLHIGKSQYGIKLRKLNFMKAYCKNYIYFTTCHHTHNHNWPHVYYLMRQLHDHMQSNFLTIRLPCRISGFQILLLLSSSFFYIQRTYGTLKQNQVKFIYTQFINYEVKPSQSH